MRNILFRGIRADNGETIIASTLIFDMSSGFFYMPMREDKTDFKIYTDDETERRYIFGILKSETPSFYRVENVCEWTGLVDKTGKQILKAI